MKQSTMTTELRVVLIPFRDLRFIHHIDLDIQCMYRITGNFCSNLFSAVFCGQLRTPEIKITEYM